MQYTTIATDVMAYAALTAVVAAAAADFTHKYLWETECVSLVLTISLFLFK